MLVVVAIAYAIIFALVKFKVFKGWNALMKWGPIGVYGALVVLYSIPMAWRAPSGPALVMMDSVEISSNVAGPVTEVLVGAGSRVDAGDVLFRIDPRPYQAAVDNFEAQLSLARQRLDQAQELASANAGSVYEVQQFDAQVRQLEAQLEGATWNLEQVEVRAPSRGLVTDVHLRPGFRVAAGQAVMPFVEDSNSYIAVQIQQNHMRNVEVGQRIEAAFKLYPGKVFSGTVDRIIEAGANAQGRASGIARTAEAIASTPVWVIVSLEDESVQLPGGATGEVAIFGHGSDNLSGGLRSLFMRQATWMNFFKA